MVHADAQTIGTHLCHLGVQALAHFCAAVVTADRAVHVDHQQCAALVQMRGGEADAELQRHECQTTLAGFALGVECMHGGAALGVVGFLLHLVDHLVTHPVFYELVVLGGHGVRRSADGGVFVEVELAHFQWVFAQSHRNFVHHRFDAEHALWATKAPESGRALCVGFAAVADQLERGQVVSVVDVQACTVVHRA